MPLALPDFAETLTAALAARHADPIAVPVIQPADPFLDTAGEDLRRRIFLTASETGESLCLRPEFTIPVCLRHIETAAGTPRRYAYLGTVFRQRRDGDSEFYQSGIEDLGDREHARADARVIDDACALLKALLPGMRPAVTVGDQGVFEAAIAALGVPRGWQKRLVHAFGDAGKLRAHLDDLAAPGPQRGFDGAVAGLLAAGSEEEIAAHIERTMIETGYPVDASRTPAEIARRLKEKAALADTRLDAAALETLRALLAVDVALGDAPAALADFACGAGLRLNDALERFAERVEALIARSVAVEGMRYRAAFGRPLDYYTGLVFEITPPGGGPVLAGGGRYDRLLTMLGARQTIPAVGFALWLDRIEALRAPSGGGPEMGPGAGAGRPA